MQLPLPQTEIKLYYRDEATELLLVSPLLPGYISQQRSKNNSGWSLIHHILQKHFVFYLQIHIRRPTN